jgi:hypothetical protein
MMSPQHGLIDATATHRSLTEIAQPENREENIDGPDGITNASRAGGQLHKQAEAIKQVVQISVCSR